MKGLKDTLADGVPCLCNGSQRHFLTLHLGPDRFTRSPWPGYWRNRLGEQRELDQRVLDCVFRLPARDRSAKANGVSVCRCRDAEFAPTSAILARRAPRMSVSHVAPQAPPKNISGQKDVSAVAAGLSSAGWRLVRAGPPCWRVLILAFAGALAGSIPAKSSATGDWTVVTAKLRTTKHGDRSDIAALQGALRSRKATSSQLFPMPAISIC